MWMSSFQPDQILFEIECCTATTKEEEGERASGILRIARAKRSGNLLCRSAVFPLGVEYSVKIPKQLGLCITSLCVIFSTRRN